MPPMIPSRTARLRLIGLLPRRCLPRGGLLLRRGRTLLPGGGGFSARRGLRLRFDAAERRLQVVEDKPDRGIAAGRRDDRGLPVTYDEDASLRGRHLELGQGARSAPEPFGRGEEL